MEKSKKLTRKIFFKEINIPCRIGVYEHEQKHHQRIIISIELALSTEVEPINDRICTLSIDQDQEYAIKFHGNPVNIFPLKNSNTEKIKEKNKTNEIFFSA